MIDTLTAALVVVDLQQKLVPAMSDPDPVLDRCRMLIRGANELHLDLLVTEQYPKGLGPTLPELSSLFPAGTPVIAKSSFSVFGSSEFRTALAARKRETLIFCGIESHVCVCQSCRDALAAGFRVAVAADGVTSRKSGDRDLALAQLRHDGVLVLSAESLLFELLGDAGNPAFKAVSKLVK